MSPEYLLYHSRHTHWQQQQEESNLFQAVCSVERERERELATTSGMPALKPGYHLI